MIYRRLVYRLHPNQYESFTRFFHEYILPNQLGHGARLVGRYTTLDRTEVTSIWEYDSHHDYERVETKVRTSDLFKKAEIRRKELQGLYLDKQEDFLEATGDYHFPKHIVSVSAYVTNEAGEVLIVKNEHRNDTYEIPGGRMERGESIEAAVKREVFEETGIHMEIDGITGVYQNLTIGVVCIVFKGHARSGNLAIHPGETKEVRFANLDEKNLSQIFTREHFRIRVEDAMKNQSMSVESYYVRPYDVVFRIEN